MTCRNYAVGGGALAASIFVAGCTPITGIPGAVGPGRGRPIGVLGVSGPNVFVNRAPASSGTAIFSGDEVSTGPGSSAIVQFDIGGFFQIDESTDPKFTEIFQNVRCILVGMFYGQGFGKDARICLNSPVADAVVGSTVNIRVSSNQSALALLQGTLVVQRPQTVALAPGQEAVATAGVPNVQVQNLSADELRSLVAWRAKFRFRGWCYDAGGARETFQDECGPASFSFKPPAPPPPANYPPPLPTYPPPQPQAPSFPNYLPPINYRPSFPDYRPPVPNYSPPINYPPPFPNYRPPVPSYRPPMYSPSPNYPPQTRALPQGHPSYTPPTNRRVPDNLPSNSPPMIR